MDKTSVLLEIGTEEMPAQAIFNAAKQLEELLGTSLKQARIEHGLVKSYATPRRLAVIVKELEDNQKAVIREEKGPAVEIAFTEDGQPTKAAEGFARSRGVSVEELVVKEHKGRKFVYLEKLDEGLATKELLAQIFNEVINQLYFPKTMRWGGGKHRFVRPVHWLVALWGDEVIPFEIFGVQSGNISSGHRFWSGLFKINSAEEYLEQLRENLVIVDFEERQKIIEKYLQEEASKIGGFPLVDKDILSEVTFLVEYPKAFSGSFAEKYLTLPEEVLITVMKKHQRYFALKNDQGLLASFINVISGNPNSENLIRLGNEKILQGRFEDALFFFNEDCKHSLYEHAQQLANVTFLEGLGSLTDKVRRLEELVECIGQKLAWDSKKMCQLKESAKISKADLTTLMVGELPELQGIIGRHYAEKSGLAIDICQAVAEHYKPRFADDQLPQGDLGLVLGLADKLDNLVAAFYTGNTPSGSQDPLALRRQGLAAVRIMLELEKDLDLDWLLDIMAEIYIEQGYAISDCQKDILEFIINRYKRYLADKGFTHDMVEALVEGNCRNFKEGFQKIKALEALKDDQDFKVLIQSYIRTVNILKNRSDFSSIDEELWEETQEKNLFEETVKLRNIAQAWEEEADYFNLFKALAQLAQPLNDFFDNVMVMAKDEKIKENRLALLALVRETLDRGVNLTKIIVE